MSWPADCGLHVIQSRLNFVCNNVTSGKFLKRKSWAEKSRSESHMTTIIQDFTLVSLTSSIMTHPAGLPLGVAVPSLLRTRLPTHSSPYALILPLRPCTSRKNIPLRYLSEIVHLSRHEVCHPRSSQYAARKLSCWLDAINAPPLCGSQPRHQSTRVTGWTTSGHLQYVISSMTKDHLQYAIEYSGKLAPWRRSDGYPPSVCHQVSQQWLDGKGVTDIYPLVGHQYWPEP